MSGISRRDLAMVLLALVGVAMLVGLAARPGGEAGVADLPTEPLVVAVQTGVWLIFAADILVTIAILDALWYRRHMAKPGKPRHWTRTLAMYLAALAPTLLAAVVILYVRKANGGAATFLMPGSGFGSARFPAPTSAAGATTATVAPWLGFVFALIIVIAFLSWLLWPSGKRRETRVRMPQPHVVVTLAVEESLEMLRAIPDPRRAIIAAYSSMERSMSGAGWPRRASEAPVEFVARVLAAVAGMSADLTRLTELFEVAKFSDHVIDEGMRDDAIGALSAIRERLREAAPAPA